MTIVYGVTFVGGRLQIEKQLKELDVPDEILFKGSSYLVHQVFRSIGELFKSARKIQVCDGFVLQPQNAAARSEVIG